MAHKKITILLTPDEMDALKRALEKSGMRSKAELVRLLVKEYLRNAK